MNRVKTYQNGMVRLIKTYLNYLSSDYFTENNIFSANGEHEIFKDALPYCVVYSFKDNNDSKVVSVTDTENSSMTINFSYAKWNVQMFFNDDLVLDSAFLDCETDIAKVNERLQKVEAFLRNVILNTFIYVGDVHKDSRDSDKSIHALAVFYRGMIEVIDSNFIDVIEDWLKYRFENVGCSSRDCGSVFNSSKDEIISVAYHYANFLNRKYFAVNE